MAEHGGTTPAGIQLFRTEHESGSERKTAEISQRELDAIKAASSRYFVSLISTTIKAWRSKAIIPSSFFTKRRLRNS